MLTRLDSRDDTEGSRPRLAVAEVMQGHDDALAAEPRNLDLLNWRGRWLAFVGRFDDSEADSRRCREVDPSYVSCRVNLAGVLIACE